MLCMLLLSKIIDQYFWMFLVCCFENIYAVFFSNFPSGINFHLITILLNPATTYLRVLIKYLNHIFKIVPNPRDFQMLAVLNMLMCFFSSMFTMQLYCPLFLSDPLCNTPYNVRCLCSLFQSSMLQILLDCPSE